MTKRFFLTTTILLLAASAGTTLAFGSDMEVRFWPAGEQEPALINAQYETFNNAVQGSDGSFTTHFGDSGFTGIYTGDMHFVSANQYGGAGGSGKFISTNTSYTLSLNKDANYFGLWFSALDAGNSLDFYKGDTEVYSFTPKDFINIVGKCHGGSNDFCGNPNNGNDKGEQFAYLSFYNATHAFDKIVFTETNHAAGFESDNHSVDFFDAPPSGGTIISSSPEPATFGAGMLGIALTLGSRLRRRGKPVR